MEGVYFSSTGKLKTSERVAKSIAGTLFRKRAALRRGSVLTL